FRPCSNVFSRHLSNIRTKSTTGAKEHSRSLALCPLWALCEIPNGGMTRNQCERLLKQFFARRNFMPRRGTGWVGERNQIEAMFCAFHSKFVTNHFLEF